MELQEELLGSAGRCTQYHLASGFVDTPNGPEYCDNVGICGIFPYRDGGLLEPVPCGGNICNCVYKDHELPRKFALETTTQLRTMRQKIENLIRDIDTRFNGGSPF